MLKGYDRELREFHRLIEGVDVVSFDIFDTLLIRPYIKPVDLFKHLEEKYSIDGFAKERVLAEKRARNKHLKEEDITLDEIYAEILEPYKYLKSAELELEEKVLHAHPFIKKLYDIAISMGKKCIAVSDMYLPEGFLRKVLDKNSYTQIEKIFVSSEEKKCKNTCSLYKSVIDNLKVSPEKILHIGDNLTADFYRAKDAGLNAILIEKYIDKFGQTQCGKRFNLLNKNSSTLDLSILTALCAEKLVFSDNDYWYNFSYILGGILALAYVHYLNKKCKFLNIEHLLFVSRDGYLLEKIYNMYSDAPVRTSYIYAPRILNLKCFGDCRNNNEYRNTLSKLINKNYDMLTEDDINAYTEECRTEYSKYLDSLNITSNRCAVVDVITGAFSSLAFLKHFLGSKILLGLYTATFNDNVEFIYDSYLKEVPENNSIFVVNIWELLITSPEPPIIDFKDLKPVYKEINSYDEYRQFIFGYAEKAILDFANNYLSLFRNYEPEIKQESISKLYSVFKRTLTKEDKQHLEKVYHPADACNSLYEPIYKKITIRKCIGLIKSLLKKKYVNTVQNLKLKAKTLIYKYTNKRIRR